MKTLYELIHDKNSLPSGNVYLKKIKGKEYFYYQYREDNQNFTKKITNKEAEELLSQINERKLIETQINKLLKNGNKEIELSTYAKEYTGYIMSEDTVVAEFEKGSLVSYNEKLCPLVIKYSHSLLNFLKSRSIDSGRTNSRLLRKILNINVKDETLISLCSYAASITDNYWFKPKHSKLKYKDISFNNDIFFDTALKGLISIYPKKIILTPELTTNGSYEKGWRNINGQWWLYKTGTKEEIYSEMFYSRLLEELSLPTAHYEIDGVYIKTLNFSPDANFEPMISIAGDNDDVKHVYTKLNELNHQIAIDYLRLCIFDVVLNNIDRHNENCGLIRNRRTGEIISLAPNYDDNLCLISRSNDLMANDKEGFLKDFLRTISDNEIKEALKEITLPSITEQILDRVNEQIELDINVDFERIKQYILYRYNTIISKINK